MIKKRIQMKFSHKINEVKMDTQFNRERLFDNPNPNKRYLVTDCFRCKGFTKLMKMVLLTKRFPDLVDNIKSYLVSLPEELNKQNEYGWTALMLACRHSNTVSSEETVRILIDANANVDVQNSDGWTALIISSLNCKSTSSEETIKMLIGAGANPQYY